MRKLPTSSKKPIDFSISTSGEGFVSQRKAAELLGVPRSTLQYAMKNPTLYDGTLAGVNHSENNQLDENTLTKLAYHFAQKGNERALRTMYAFTLAGARAYIYSQVGVTLNPPRFNRLHEPCIPVRWLAQQLNRSPASVNRTIKASLNRLSIAGHASEELWVGAERRVSPAVVLCSSLTGKDITRVKAWLLSLTENNQLPDAETLNALLTPLPHAVTACKVINP